MADFQGAPFLASSQSRIGDLEDATSQEAKQTIDAPRIIGLHALLNRPLGNSSDFSIEDGEGDPFVKGELREKTENSHTNKPCVRCQMLKIQCQTNENDSSGVCRACQEVSKQQINGFPCFSYQITECTLYRTGTGPGLERTSRWSKVELKDITD
ncbi:hypothetical protein GX50_01697 [[Emmonsia] crescens]|uniref:Uncharacterized protein n=1 Tax=[Emmonsia] crescens TaxID=73230 RepID=A0A2B7ZR59_9EURO|nr:hypothetical protein GX50_01697 [Emmonsia crescens]